MNTVQQKIETPLGQALGNAMFQVMGVDTMAYIKPTMGEQGESYKVYSSDGTELASFPTKEAAYYTARQHNLTPVNLQ